MQAALALAEALYVASPVMREALEDFTLSHAAYTAHVASNTKEADMRADSVFEPPAVTAEHVQLRHELDQAWVWAMVNGKVRPLHAAARHPDAPTNMPACISLHVACMDWPSHMNGCG